MFILIHVVTVVSVCIHHIVGIIFRALNMSLQVLAATARYVYYISFFSFPDRYSSSILIYLTVVECGSKLSFEGR